MDPDDAAVAGNQAVLVHVGAGPLRPTSAEDRLPVVGMQDLAEEAGVREPLLGAVPEHRLDGRAHVDARDLVVGPVHVRDERQVVDEHPIPLLDVAPRPRLRRVAGSPP